MWTSQSKRSARPCSIKLCRHGRSMHCSICRSITRPAKAAMLARYCQNSSDALPLRWTASSRNLPASFATKLLARESNASSIILKRSHSPLLPGCARLALIRGASSMKLSEVAQKLACRLEGAPDTEIRGIAGIEHAEPGQITFLANRRYFPLLKTTRASAVLIEDGISLDRGAGSPPIAALRTPNPYLAFAHAIELFYQPPRYEPGIHPTAVIAPTARI